MGIAYFDTGALVKLVVDEDGSDLAAQLWDGADAVTSSRLAYAEGRAALAGAARGGRLTAAGLASAKRSWERFWAGVRPVEALPAIVRAAGDLAERYALRAYDALHLASALALDDRSVVVATWDLRLRAGVRHADLRLAPAP